MHPRTASTLHVPQSLTHLPFSPFLRCPPASVQTFCLCAFLVVWLFVLFSSLFISYACTSFSFSSSSDRFLDRFYSDDSAGWHIIPVFNMCVSLWPLIRCSRISLTRFNYHRLLLHPATLPGKLNLAVLYWPQIFVINLPSAELSLSYKTPTKAMIEQSHVCFWKCLWLLHLLLLENWICFCSMTTTFCDKFTIYWTLIIVRLTHQSNSNRCSNPMHFLLGKTHIASKWWIWLCGNLVKKNPSVEINHNRRTWGALGWQLADVIMYLKSISTGIKKQYSLWETMDLSKVHSSLEKSRKFRHPIASCSTLPEQSGNPSGPYLPVSRTGISLSCSHAKHHSSSPPNSLSVIKCKVPAAVVKWRDDVKTGALVNTDSVVELCCFPSRPVYLFQSINHDARPTPIRPHSACFSFSV